ncbi:GMC oxidoreductase-like protein [Phanerochaete sordida]|uniref:GMC oxidoreductase-like protein n=1 Tax=Phanerochaete sordida TaxID=48140 RepID=A0A9P3GB36_9APHY|nr:GMC oxidoreductase-like protein [Phanerochaete sordida]
MLEDPALMAKQRASLSLVNPYTLVIHNFTFLPLQVLSSQSQALIERKAEEIALAQGSLPDGLKKQYEIQLRMLKSTTGVDVEIMGSPLVIRPFNEPDKPHFTLSSVVARPWSRGSIHVSSTDPKTPPKIDPRYFTDEIDLDVLCEAFKFAIRVAATEPLKSMIAYRAAPPENTDLSSDEKIKRESEL